jgi:F420-dependent oxidoreductase-like protein
MITMLLGLQIPSFTWPGGPAGLAPTLRSIATDADQAGVSSLWVMDHFFQIRGVGPSENDMLEAYTTLGWLAAATERITLGTMVTGITYRYPGLLIKTVTTLDVLSGGRAWLGIGAAWNEEEHAGLGVPFPPVAERFERLEETLRLADQMWRDDDSPFQGTHYGLARPMNHPQPLSTPRPRLLVGGGGEKKTLRFVAQYADACNLFAYDEQALRHKLGVLREHCEAVGRDYAEIEKTTLDTIDLRPGKGTVAGYVERFAAHAELGVDQVIVNMPAVEDPAAREPLAELVQELAKITPAGR